MKMLMQNNDLMKMVSAAASSAAKQSPDIGLQICQRKSKRSKIKDMIADGPPPVILQPLPPPEHEPPPLEQWTATQKKKKRVKNKKKRSTVFSTAAPGPLAFENMHIAIEGYRRSRCMHQKCLGRRRKKRRRRKIKSTRSRMLGQQQHVVDENVKNFGCSKCCFLPKGCSACRDW